MSEPTDDNEQRSDVQEERRDDAQQRNPDLHGAALDVLEGEDDGAGRPLGG